MGSLSARTAARSPPEARMALCGSGTRRAVRNCWPCLATAAASPAWLSPRTAACWRAAAAAPTNKGPARSCSGKPQRAAGVQQVGTSIVEVLIDEEVFLLGPDRGEDLLGVLVAEEPQDAQGLLRQGLH